MAELIQVGRKSQIKLPQAVQEELGIKESDFLEAQVRNGEIILRRQKPSGQDQSWFWTERWQQGEKAAEEDITAGRVQRFGDSGEASVFLKKQKRKKVAKNKKENRK